MPAQAVVADAALVRMAGADAAPGGMAALQRDMPRAVPLGRWDADASQHAKHGARFSGFLQGAPARADAVHAQGHDVD